ncbi:MULTISPECIES: hypothetical protein [Methylomonas]|uniref:Uncharacterized protein n=1 Tax=Methylomonas koyamae TaxID=702114 RepID=A0A177P6H4_9GAMM|nr:hypothetical protein [Methylomonas koyamae]OAI25063.1 hypothetical protein A1355_20030 [Methylomonas koyamae]
MGLLDRDWYHEALAERDRKIKNGHSDGTPTGKTYDVLDNMNLTNIPLPAGQNSKAIKAKTLLRQIKFAYEKLLEKIAIPVLIGLILWSLYLIAHTAIRVINAGH